MLQEQFNQLVESIDDILRSCQQPDKVNTGVNAITEFLQANQAFAIKDRRYMQFNGLLTLLHPSVYDSYYPLLNIVLALSRQANCPDDLATIYTHLEVVHSQTNRSVVQDGVCELETMGAGEQADKVRAYLAVNNEFSALWQEAEAGILQLKQLGCAIPGRQVLVMATKENRIYHFVNDVGCREPEDQQLAVIAKEKLAFDRILCMWTSGQVDLPSFRFRKGLVDANLDNKNAKLLLQGSNGFTVCCLANTLPSQ